MLLSIQAQITKINQPIKGGITMDILVSINNQSVFEGNAEDYLESMDYDSELELFLSNFMTDNSRQIETYQSDDIEIEFEKIENIL